MKISSVVLTIPLDLAKDSWPACESGRGWRRFCSCGYSQAWLAVDSRTLLISRESTVCAILFQS